MMCAVAQGGQQMSWRTLESKTCISETAHSLARESRSSLVRRTKILQQTHFYVHWGFDTHSTNLEQAANHYESILCMYTGNRPSMTIYIIRHALDNTKTAISSKTGACCPVLAGMFCMYKVAISPNQRMLEVGTRYTHMAIRHRYCRSSM